MRIFTLATASQNPAAILMQVSESGIGGDFWNNTTKTWEPFPAIADRKIPLASFGLTDGYVGGVSDPVGSYTGGVIIMIIDQNDGNRIIGADEVYLTAGVTHRVASTLDVSSIPLAVRTTLNSTPVPASNMVDISGLATAAGLTSSQASIEADIAALDSKVTTVDTVVDSIVAGQVAIGVGVTSIDGKLPGDTSTKINRLDATISSRSSHDPAAVRAELASNPVPASNMRGTDNAFLAASWVAPSNAAIATAAADAAAAKTAAQATETRLTATRAGYLDNLSGGAVALASQVTAPGATRSKMVGVSTAILPTIGSTSVRIEILLFDGDGALNDPDSNVVTFTAANQAGVSRTGNLTGVTRAGVGRYYVDYAITSGHAQEQITIFAAWAEQTIAMTDALVFSVALQATTEFGTADRTKLDAIHAKLPSASYLTGTAASSGVIDAGTIGGDKTSFKADVSTLATTAQLNALETHGDATWSTATGFLVSNDARLNYLDASISSRSDYVPPGALATAASIAALQSHGDSSWSTATGYLASNDARLNYLDAAISSRSTFAGTNVTLASGHGLALESTAQSIKTKTDALPASPAAVSDVPSAAAIAGQVDATLITSHGSGSWTTGTATLANQTSILNSLAAIDGVVSISASTVAPKRTWRIPAGREVSLSPQIITLSIGESVTLAMDFADILNAGTSLSTTNSVTGATASGLSVDQTRTRAHFTVTPDTAGTFRIKVTATTTDGQTITAEGYLEVI